MAVGERESKLAERLAERLGGYADGPRCVANCPAHEDGELSLRIVVTPQGRWELACRQGCSREAVSDAVGQVLKGEGKAGATGRRVEGYFDTAELMREEIAPIRWVAPQLLAEGLTIFGGKGKIGKSLMALGLCLEVARGGKVFGSIEAPEGDVLYLALEDPKRRLQERLTVLLGATAPPARPAGLQFRRDCPPLDEGGTALIDGWLREHPRARLVVVDTFKRVRPRQRSGRAYDEDYDALRPLADVAARHRVAIVVIHHLRKAEAEDILDLLNGSSGLAAVVDGLLIMRRTRGQADATLHVVHKDMESRELALGFDGDSLTWRLLGDAREYGRSKERGAVLELLRDGGSMTPAEIADALGRNRSTMRSMVMRMATDGELRREGARYAAPGVAGVAGVPPEEMEVGQL